MIELLIFPPSPLNKRSPLIPYQTDEPVDLQLPHGHSCPYKTGHPFLTISTNGMQDFAQANIDQSEHSSSWMTANGTLIVFQLPRTGPNQIMQSSDQLTLFLNFGHATSCYKGSPQKCFKIIKNSSKSPIFKTRIWLENEAGMESEKLELAMKVGRNVKREFKKMTEG